MLVDFNLYIYFFIFLNDLPHLPVGNCAEANLVSRIPAPSINASSIPPIAAEPNMATGPSVMRQEMNITQVIFLNK